MSSGVIRGRSVSSTLCQKFGDMIFGDRELVDEKLGHGFGIRDGAFEYEFVYADYEGPDGAFLGSRAHEQF